MSVITMKQLLMSVFIPRHQTRRWNLKCGISFNERNGIYIIDLQNSSSMDVTILLKMLQ